jgi:hypothetical protein
MTITTSGVRIYWIYPGSFMEVDPLEKETGSELENETDLVEILKRILKLPVLF